VNYTKVIFENWALVEYRLLEAIKFGGPWVSSASTKCSHEWFRGCYWYARKHTRTHTHTHTQ